MTTRHPSPRLFPELLRLAVVALTVWALAATLWAAWPERAPF